MPISLSKPLKNLKSKAHMLVVYKLQKTKRKQRKKEKKRDMYKELTLTLQGIKLDFSSVSR